MPPPAALELADNPSKTLTAALSLLHSLKPQVTELLFSAQRELCPLRVALNEMDIMKPVRRDEEMAHVLWVGPELVCEEGQRLHNVCGERT
jgi:hypothetical protein